MKRDAGFTLIEVIVTLILVGILATAGGMAIVQAVRGYVLTRDNAAITQKAQLATSRITREIVEMVGVTSNASSTSLPIKNLARNVTLGLDSGAIKIAPDGVALSGGDILLNNVNSFTLTYYSGDSVISPPTTAYAINNLTAIDVNFQVARSDGGSQTFANRISPRNNKNEGGPPAPLVPMGLGGGGGGGTPGCFIATVAYGDAYHPMVQLLRDFRDRFLLSWQGGRWFVKQYYIYGPEAAETIRNRPVAIGVVRLLLYPLAALTFFLVYAPLAIPFILLIAMIVNAALFSAGRRKGAVSLSVIPHQRGSILIALVFTILIMATLGAAMLPMFSSSYMNQVYADQGRKTYFLAESGFRHAAGNYLNAPTESARQIVLADLNNKTCSLSGNGGSFTTIVYPHWFTTQAAAAGANSLATTLNGTIPQRFSGSITGGQIQIKEGGTYNYYAYGSGNGSGTTVTFTLSAPLSAAISAGWDVVPVALPNSTTTISASGSNLTLNGTGVNAFPLLNGNFILKDNSVPPNLNVYNYQKRDGSTLVNITMADPAKSWKNISVTSGPLTTPTTTKIVLEKFLQLSSTGSFGSTSREVIYNVPVGSGGAVGFTKEQYQDKFDSAANWSAPGGSSGFGGTHSIQSIDGGNALKVDSAPPGGVWTGNWAMSFFNWGNTSTNLAKAWLDAQGLLSYDLQVKVYNTQPYFFAGMNFRTRNNSDNTDIYTYGVSFIKPRQTRYCRIFTCDPWVAPIDQDTALIPGYVDDLTAGPLFSNPGLFSNLEQTSQPLFDYQERYGLPAIVLWKRTGANFEWLAYRTLTTADGIVYAPGSPANALRLTNWSTLMVRVAEGYSLAFNNGGGTAGIGVPIKEGDIISNLGDTKRARVVMTPILTSGTWSGRNAAGTFILANIFPNIAGSFTSGENLYVNNVQLARANGNLAATKQNYLRVYYTRPAGQGTANVVETDNNRLANPRDYVNWPPDDLTELSVSNDYVTLVQWTGYNTGISPITSTSQPNAIIANGDLVTPAWTSTSTYADFVFPNGNAGDYIALMTSSGSATSSYYDDFAIQLDLDASTSGTGGFMPPIQQ